MSDEPITPAEPVTPNEPVTPTEPIKKVSVKEAVNKSNEKELRDLQNRYSTLEKKYTDLGEMLEGINGDLTKLKGIPSPTTPKRTMFDELCDALGWAHINQLDNLFKQ